MIINKIKKILIAKSDYHYVFFDQIIVSGSSFLISILVLRFLGIESFGIFSILWLLLLFFYSVQQAYIISPLLTNAPKQSLENLNFFYGSALIQQIIFMFIIFIISFCFLEFFGDYIKDYNIRQFSISFALTLLFSQFYQFLRRVYFSKKLFVKVIISDILVYSIIIFSIIYLNFKNELYINKIFWLFFISFFFGTLFNLSVILSFSFNIKKLLNFFRENWHISKWLLFTSILQWFSGNLWVINAGIILGPYILGIVRACQNILNIANLIFQSFENIIPSNTSKKFMSGGKKLMNDFLHIITKQGILLTLCLAILIIIFAKPILYLFYGNEIASYSKILSFLSFLIPLHFLQYPVSYGLRTLGNTKPIFISYLFTSIITILISIYIIDTFKIYGLIFGLYLSQIAITSYLYISYKKYIY